MITTERDGDNGPGQTLASGAAGAAGGVDLAQARRLRSGHIARAEWIKLASLRSTWIAFVVAAVALASLGVLACSVTNAHWAEMSAAERAQFEPVVRSLGGVSLAWLPVGVLGVLVVTGEYATGMIRSSLLAVPRRLPVFLGKLAVLAAATFLLMLAAAFVAFLAGQTALGAHGTTLAAPHALRAVIGAALYCTVVAAFAVGLGFALRSTGGAIATLCAAMLVLPPVAGLLPDTWREHLAPYLPSSAGAGLYEVQPSPGMLTTWAGFAVFCAWAATALLAGAVRLRRQDA